MLLLKEHVKAFAKGKASYFRIGEEWFDRVPFRNG
jgi:hypothetical protein